jgi:hypothetical protein
MELLMSDHYPCFQKPARPVNRNYPPCACPHNFHCAALIRDLIREAIEAERARAAAAEAELWGACFGQDAQANQQSKDKRIIRAASARALLTLLNTTPKQAD